MNAPCYPELTGEAESHPLIEHLGSLLTNPNSQLISLIGSLRHRG